MWMFKKSVMALVWDEFTGNKNTQLTHLFPQVSKKLYLKHLDSGYQMPLYPTITHYSIVTLFPLLG